MSTITAADVQSLRKRTGLPLMDCKKALAEADGDPELAIRKLRERGNQILSTRGERETSFGRFGIYTGSNVGTMVELKCESAPVAQNEEFVQLAADLACQLATGPGAATAEELLSQPSPSKKGTTLAEQKDELFNRMREVFQVGRMVRYDGPCGSYEHTGARVHGVLLEATGDATLLKDICMHIAALNPSALTRDTLDPEEIAREREILKAAALKEGKPEAIVDKMVEGRLQNFYAERVLTEQEFVKSQDKKTVGEFAKDHGITLKRYAHWILGG